MKHRTFFMFSTGLLFVLCQFLPDAEDPSFHLLVALLRYAIPALFGFLLLAWEECRQRDTELPTEIPDLPTSFSISKMLRLIPLICPVVFSIFCVSFLTQTIAGQSLEPVEGNYMENLWWHALLPALGEEILFRYLPIRLIGSNRKLCLPVSAALFALIHANYLQMPYALLAGIFFCSIDLCFDSLVPSIILHFFTNAVSLAWMNYGYENWFLYGFLPIFLLLTFASSIYLLVKREDIVNKWLAVFHNEKKEESL